uniref:Uncharacterized protein n=2 Tax=Cacopsylla melanoneura TaxID=428564 RepID=A0A8D8T0N8_9HEMI
MHRSHNLQVLVPQLVRVPELCLQPTLHPEHRTQIPSVRFERCVRFLRIDKNAQVFMIKEQEVEGDHLSIVDSEIVLLGKLLTSLALLNVHPSWFDVNRYHVVIGQVFVQGTQIFLQILRKVWVVECIIGVGDYGVIDNGLGVGVIWLLNGYSGLIHGFNVGRHGSLS